MVMTVGTDRGEANDVGRKDPVVATAESVLATDHRARPDSLVAAAGPGALRQVARVAAVGMIGRPPAVTGAGTAVTTDRPPAATVAFRTGATVLHTVPTVAAVRVTIGRLQGATVVAGPAEGRRDQPVRVVVLLRLVLRASVVGERRDVRTRRVRAAGPMIALGGRTTAPGPGETVDEATVLRHVVMTGVPPRGRTTAAAPPLGVVVIALVPGLPTHGGAATTGLVGTVLVRGHPTPVGAVTLAPEEIVPVPGRATHVPEATVPVPRRVVVDRTPGGQGRTPTARGAVRGRQGRTSRAAETVRIVLRDRGGIGTLPVPVATTAPETRVHHVPEGGSPRASAAEEAVAATPVAVHRTIAGLGPATHVPPARVGGIAARARTELLVGTVHVAVTRTHHAPSDSCAPQRIPGRRSRVTSASSASRCPRASVRGATSRPLLRSTATTSHAVSRPS